MSTYRPRQSLRLLPISMPLSLSLSKKQNPCIRTYRHPPRILKSSNKITRCLRHARTSPPTATELDNHRYTWLPPPPPLVSQTQSLQPPMLAPKLSTTTTCLSRLALTHHCHHPQRLELQHAQRRSTYN